MVNLLKAVRGGGSPKEKHVLPTALLALILGVTYVLGIQYGETGFLEFGFWGNAVRIVISSMFAFLLLIALRYAIVGFRNSQHPVLTAAAPRLNGRSIALHALLVFGFWCLWLLCFYPGSMNWDTFFQIYQWYPENHPFLDNITREPINEQFLDTNPIFDTLIFGTFAVGSDALFGTQNYGVFLYVALQSAALSLALTTLIAYTEKWADGLSAQAFRGLGLLFCALFPPLGIFAATMIKDSLFTVCFVGYMIVFLEIARTKGEILSNKRVFWLFAGASLLCALTKRPGVHLVILVAVLALLFLKLNRGRMIASCLIALIVAEMLVPITLYPLLGVARSQSSEIEAILWQQTARYAVVHGEDTSEIEKEVIDRRLGYFDLAERYDPHLNDPVKNNAHYDISSEDNSRYLRVWLEQGLRHPRAYIESILATSAGYFAPTADIVIYANTGTYDDGALRLTNPKLLQPLHEGATAIYDWLKTTPLTRWLFQISLYSFVIPLICLFATWQNESIPRKSTLILYVPVAISLLICILSPYAWGRYVLPLIAVAPTLMIIAFGSSRYKIDEKPVMNGGEISHCQSAPIRIRKSPS